MEEALSAQKEYFSKKHIDILKNHSEKLKQKYEQNFIESLKNNESETSGLKLQIEKLTLDLKIAKQKLICSGQRRPVYSPGKYCENG